jgi:DNA-binding NarL/FixJ family response regulator
MTQPPSVHDQEARYIRVLIVCNERVIRAGLRALVQGHGGVTVVGDLDDLHTALTTIAAERPDVTVVDPDHYRSDDVEELLLVGGTSTRFVLLTGSPDAMPISAILENGVVGLVLKQQPPDILIKAIDKVHAGELWLDRSATARLIAELSRASQAGASDRAWEKAARLTQRERQVIALVGEGLRNSQIANRLSISEVTVRNHLTSIFRKLELANRFQLVIYAFQHGLATLPLRGTIAAPMSDLHMLGYQKKTS